MQAQPQYQLVQQITAHSTSVSFVKFSPDGRQLAVASADKTISVWSIPLVNDPFIESSASLVNKQHVLSAGNVRRLVGHTGGVSTLAWMPESEKPSRYLASGSDDSTIRLWDITDDQCIKILRGHRSPVFCLAFNPQGSLIVSGSVDETVRLWETATGKLIRVIPAHSDVITALSFTKDGKRFASSSFDGLCRIWDTDSGSCLSTLTDKNNVPASACRFTPNSKYILVSYLEDKIWLYDVNSEKPVKVYTGHKNTNYCITAEFTTTKGKWVVSGSEDGHVYLWDLQTREVKQIINAYSSNTGVLALDCHPTLSMIVCGGLEEASSVRLFVDRNDPNTSRYILSEPQDTVMENV